MDAETARTIRPIFRRLLPQVLECLTCIWMRHHRNDSFPRGCHRRVANRPISSLLACLSIFRVHAQGLPTRGDRGVLLWEMHRFLHYLPILHGRRRVRLPSPTRTRRTAIDTGQHRFARLSRSCDFVLYFIARALTAHCSFSSKSADASTCRCTRVLLWVLLRLRLRPIDSFRSCTKFSIFLPPSPALPATELR